MKPKLWNHEKTQELIRCVESNPCLYNVKGGGNSCLKQKDKAWSNILKQLQSIDSSLTIEEIKRKWRNIRVQFMHEFRMIHKVNEYVPKLWCYSLLGFLKEHVVAKKSKEEDEEEFESRKCANETKFRKKKPQNTRKLWTRESVVALIKLYQKYEHLYNVDSPLYKDQDMRDNSLIEICNRLKKFNKSITVDEVRRKMRNLRIQYGQQLRDMEIAKSNGERLEEARLWCFDRLNFLRKYTVVKKTYSSGVSTSLSEISEYSDSGDEDENPCNDFMVYEDTKDGHSEEEVVQAEYNEDSISPYLEETIDGTFTEPAIQPLCEEKEIKSYYIDAEIIECNEPEDVQEVHNEAGDDMQNNDPFTALPEPYEKMVASTSNTKHKLRDNKPQTRKINHKKATHMKRVSSSEVHPVNMKKRKIEVDQKLLNIQSEQSKNYDWLGNQVAFEINTIRNERVRRDTVWRIQKLLYDSFQREKRKNYPDPLNNK
ncbi:uncharacterized protein [Musca autumnalis]|uniref:uncharacterized protein n=1 Tax=Musca autumnalis TaxID=221902 RepID=UPI003CF89309